MPAFADFRLRSSRAVTLDGEEIELSVNIEMPQDIDKVKEVDAAGIGLFGGGRSLVGPPHGGFAGQSVGVASADEIVGAGRNG